MGEGGTSPHSSIPDSRGVARRALLRAFKKLATERVITVRIGTQGHRRASRPRDRSRSCRPDESVRLEPVRTGASRRLKVPRAQPEAVARHLSRY
jgi:hypothetical protein